MKISVPKAKSLTKQMLPYLKNTLTGPGSFLPYYLRSFHYQGPPSVLFRITQDSGHARHGDQIHSLMSIW